MFSNIILYFVCFHFVGCRNFASVFLYLLQRQADLACKMLNLNGVRNGKSLRWTHIVKIYKSINIAAKGFRWPQPPPPKTARQTYLQMHKSHANQYISHFSCIARKTRAIKLSKINKFGSFCIARFLRLLSASTHTCVCVCVNWRSSFQFSIDWNEFIVYDWHEEIKWISIINTWNKWRMKIVEVNCMLMIRIRVEYARRHNWVTTPNELQLCARVCRASPFERTITYPLETHVRAANPNKLTTTTNLSNDSFSMRSILYLEKYHAHTHLLLVNMTIHE